MNEISLADTKRVGREDTGYVNNSKDWVLYDLNINKLNIPIFFTRQIQSIDIEWYAKDNCGTWPWRIFGARLIADRLYSRQNDKIKWFYKDLKQSFALESAFLMKGILRYGKHLFQWVFQKILSRNRKLCEYCYNLKTFYRTILGLRPNTPGITIIIKERPIFVISLFRLMLLYSTLHVKLHTLYCHSTDLGSSEPSNLVFLWTLISVQRPSSHRSHPSRHANMFERIGFLEMASTHFVSAVVAPLAP